MTKLRSMRRIVEEELTKIHNYRFTYLEFVNASEINKVREKMKLNNIRFRTVPVFRDSKIIGYKIYVRDN